MYEKGGIKVEKAFKLESNIHLEKYLWAISFLKDITRRLNWPFIAFLGNLSSLRNLVDLKASKSNEYVSWSTAVNFQ